MKQHTDDDTERAKKAGKNEQSRGREREREKTPRHTSTHIAVIYVVVALAVFQFSPKVFRLQSRRGQVKFHPDTQGQAHRQLYTASVAAFPIRKPTLYRL